MDIRKAVEAEYDLLVEIWEAAVRATHDFLSEAHICYYRSRIRTDYLPGADIYVAAEETDGPPLAFMGLTPPLTAEVDGKQHTQPAHLAMLFVHPGGHGRGLGRALVEHAAGLYGELHTDVNEQNPGALRFYRKCGFEVTGRSATDGEGNPFPLLYLRREG